MNFYKNDWLLIAFLLLCNLFCFSQITFNKGFIIDNSGTKTECLIKNYDWRTNPVKIQYKLTDSADEITKKIDSIKEFGINDLAHYVRVSIRIDRSPFELENLSNSRKPKWSEETVFLKELVCGKAGLWIYTEPEQFWFFYTIDNSLPEQLINKEYLVDDKVAKNEAFKQQILAYLQNENTKKVNVYSINYDEQSLIKYFKQYNSTYEYCPRTDFDKPERDVFILKAAGSANYSSLLIYNPQILFVFDSKLNWSSGLEAEYYLPFNNNTWSVLISPTYEHIFFSQKIQGTQRIMNLQSVTFPIGGRYTKYLKNDIRCFASIYLNSIICLRFNDNFQYSSNVSLDVHEANSFVFGGGASFRNFGIELKYHTSRDLLANYISWYSKYPKASLTVSYKLFHITGK